MCLGNSLHNCSVLNPPDVACRLSGRNASGTNDWVASMLAFESRRGNKPFEYESFLHLLQSKQKLRKGSWVIWKLSDKRTIGADDIT